MLLTPRDNRWNATVPAFVSYNLVKALKCCRILCCPGLQTLLGTASSRQPGQMDVEESEAFHNFQVLTALKKNV